MNWGKFEEIPIPKTNTEEQDWKRCQHLVILEGFTYEVLMTYLTEHGYQWIAMQEGSANKCPGNLRSRFRHYYKTKEGRVVILHEKIQADHIHLLIWWNSNRTFSHTGCYQHLHKLREIWNEARHNPCHPPAWCKATGPMMTSQKINSIELAFCWFQIKGTCTFDIHSKPNRNFMILQHELLKHSNYPINIVVLNNLIRLHGFE